MFVSYDNDKRITVISDHSFSVTGQESQKIKSKRTYHELLGRHIEAKYVKKTAKDLRIAVVCNWNDRCGISTYSKFLVSELTKKVKEIKIFSEIGRATEPDGPEVIRCWTRGRSMKVAIEKVLEWKPDFIIVQHEFGIFPNACHFLQMLDMLRSTPYVVCMHSVYEHLDKTICSSAVKNSIVHNQLGKNLMTSRGHSNPVWVVPHGCVTFTETQELWNIFQTPYAIVQFGFGFFYKGVDRAIEAVHHLKNSDKKFENIFYVYLAAENPHNTSVHDTYHAFLTNKIKNLKLEDNVVIIRGFQSDQTINNYMRTAKLAIFPYMNNPDNTVYGASGAVRVAMANKIPVLASESHLFDDLEGVVPRPTNHLELAKAIDSVFSNENYRKAVLTNIENFVSNNTWNKAADAYLKVYEEIISGKL